MPESRLDRRSGDSEARLREIEAELDEELGLESEVAIATVSTSSTKPRPSFGKIALGVLGALLAWALFGKLVKLIIGLAVIVGLVAAVLWLIGVFRSGRDDV